MKQLFCLGFVPQHVQPCNMPLQYLLDISDAILCLGGSTETACFKEQGAVTMFRQLTWTAIRHT